MSVDSNPGWCLNGECQADPCTDCGANQYCGDKNTSSANARPGECKDLKFKEITVGSTTYFYSEEKLSWWDSKSACTALNKKMATVDDMVDGVDWTKAGKAGYYSGGTLTSAGAELENVLGASNWMWTDTYCSGCSSKTFFGISMKNGYISTGSRNSVSRFAVCY